jgi:hypothetical protein
VDFSNVTFSSYAWYSRGFIIHQSGGIDFGAELAASATDLSRHINLYGGTLGLTINPSSNLALVFGPASVVFQGTSSSPGYVNASGLNMPVGQSAASAGSFTTLGASGVTSLAGGARLDGAAANYADVTKHIELANTGLGFNSYSGNIGAFYGSGSFTFSSAAATMDMYVNGSGIHMLKAFGVWNAVPPASKPTVTGAKGGNAALASLLTALVSYGLILDSTGA